MLNNRIAVIGSGMAGLSAAWLLSRHGYRVSVFEKGSSPGLSAYSRDFSKLIPDHNVELMGDIPSRMFNQSLWPSVTQLYSEAGVDFEPVDHQQTFFTDQGELQLQIGLPYDPKSLLKLVLNPVARKLVSDLKRFQELGLAALESQRVDAHSFGEFIESIGTKISSPTFLNGFLYPALTSTVFTCPTEDLLRYPCRTVLDALDKITGDRQPLMKTVHGSRDAATRLLTGVEMIHRNTTVDRISQNGEVAFVHVGAATQEFDQVLVATQANHASELVRGDFPTASEILSKFRYVDVPISVHTDSSVLPPRKKDWGTFNFETSNGSVSPCTVWMNRFHSDWNVRQDFFHSIFPSERIDPSLVIASARLQRPVIDFESDSLLTKLDDLHNEDRRIWFIGSYAARGVPLLESAVQSSRSVVQRITSSMTTAIT